MKSYFRCSGYQLRLLSACLIAVSLSSCGNPPTVAPTATSNSPTEDISASGAISSAVGNALAAMTANGPIALLELPKDFSPVSWLNHLTFLDQAQAATACPTLLTANGSGCANVGKKASLTYALCNFGSSLTTWNGTLQYSMGTGTVACGTFPTIKSTTIYQQFVKSGAAFNGSRTTALGTIIKENHAEVSLANFNGDTIPVLVNSGYGKSLTYDSSGQVTGVSIYQRVTSTQGLVVVANHSLAANLTVSESGSQKTVTGTSMIYLNGLQVVGTSTFNNVVYDHSCCYAISGAVTTTFAPASGGNQVAPTKIGQVMVGGTEIMTFSNTCGSATLQDYMGDSYPVLLNNCL